MCTGYPLSLSLHCILLLFFYRQNEVAYYHSLCRSPSQSVGQQSTQLAGESSLRMVRCISFSRVSWLTVGLIFLNTQKSMAPKIKLAEMKAVFEPPDLGAPYPIAWGAEAVKYQTCEEDDKIYTEGMAYNPSCKPKGCIPDGGKSVDDTLCMIRYDNEHPQFVFKMEHTYPEGCCLERANCAPNCPADSCQSWYDQYLLETTEPMERDDFLEMYQCGEQCPQFDCMATQYQCKSRDCLKCKMYNPVTKEFGYDIAGGVEVWIPFFMQVDIQCMSSGTVENPDGSTYDWAVICGPHAVEFETNVWQNRAVGEWDCMAARAGRRPDGGYFNKFNDWSGDFLPCQFTQLLGCQCGPLDMNGFGAGPDESQPNKSIYRCTDHPHWANTEDYKYCPLICPEGSGDVLPEEGRQKVCDSLGDAVRMSELDFDMRAFLLDTEYYPAVKTYDEWYGWSPSGDLDAGYELFFDLEVTSSENAVCPQTAQFPASSDSDDGELEEGALAGVIIGSVVGFFAVVLIVLQFNKNKNVTGAAPRSSHHSDHIEHHKDGSDTHVPEETETHAHDDDLHVMH